MTRTSIAIALALVICAGATAVQPATAATPVGAITWTVDHDKKTITVAVRLQLYSGCSDYHVLKPEDEGRACRGVTSQVTQFIADKIKKKMHDVWNKGYRYRCYRLIFVVDIALAPDRGHLEGGRLGVRIDPSAVNIRSYVDVGSTNDVTKWRSNDPADRVVPENGSGETTWLEQGQGADTVETYAHELGHILGLHDAYHDEKDPKDPKKTISVPNEGAPLDMMSTGTGDLSQETIDRLVERNQDHLVDTDGDRVELKDLRCDRLFRATLTAGDRHYDASHHMNSAPKCPSPETTSSTDQDLTVDSEYADLSLVETPGVGGVGYRLTPVFDVLMLESGLAITGRRNVDIGLFDLPVTVGVWRAISRPASGAVPEVRDSRDETCAGGEGTPPPEECGRREYKSWMAMSLTGPDEIWPIASVLPATLRGIGNFGARLELLYRNCPAPTPWPGNFARDGGGATVTRGKLPSLQKITQVSDDWFNKGIPGQIEIDGGATLNEARLGFLQTNRYAWMLTLCPLDRDGNPPPDCP